jgi:hypothetical protein
MIIMYIVYPYLIIGVYRDGDVLHPTSSVELYLPWSDSWIPLPSLPNITLSDGAVLPMTNTHIMFLVTNSANMVHLVGGTSTDWNTGLETMTSKVWELPYNRANHTYYWDTSIAPDMGKYGVRCSHVVIIIFTDMHMASIESAAVGVPDNFFQHFNF